MRSKGDQGELFATEHWRETLELIPKSYRERSAIKERTKLGLLRARANGRIGGGRYKLSATQQAEAIKMIRLGEKSQAEIAELFNVDRSTISRMMKEAREKELLKAAR
jgi:DNA invertase Pin-like site-specific DNA recombinase